LFLLQSLVEDAAGATPATVRKENAVRRGRSIHWQIATGSDVGAAVWSTDRR